MGIRDLTPQDFDVFAPSLFMGLAGLAEIQVTYFYLVFIENKEITFDYAIRFSPETLTEIIDMLQERKISVIDNFLLPVELKDKHIVQLANIKKLKEARRPV